MSKSAPEASFVEGGIKPGQYYDGGGAASDLAEQLLAKFDDMDFEVFSNQDWARVHESHHENVVATWPDGHSTVGIDAHIEDLAKLFVHAPDTEIKQHPVRIASDNWTAVMGVMTGTLPSRCQRTKARSSNPPESGSRSGWSRIAYWQAATPSVSAPLTSARDRPARAE